MSDDIMERLRDADENSVQRVNGSRIFGDAADEIERLRELVTVLEARMIAASDAP